MAVYLEEEVHGMLTTTHHWFCGMHLLVERAASKLSAFTLQRDRFI